MFNKARFDAVIRLHGETIKDAAEVMGLNETTLYLKRVGRSDFRLKDIEAYCRHYMVSPVDVFFDGLAQDTLAERWFDRLAEEWTCEKQKKDQKEGIKP